MMEHFLTKKKNGLVVDVGEEGLVVILLAKTR